jgi:hypothetical protein
MSVRTKWYNTEKRMLNSETKKEIEELVETEDRYISNIEDSLRQLNEHELANQMLHELQSQRRTSPIRISVYTKQLLNHLKKKKEDGSIESYDDVIINLLG